MNSAMFLERDGVILRKQPRKKILTLWDAHFADHALKALEKAHKIFDHTLALMDMENVSEGDSTIKDQKQINEFMIDTTFHRGGRIDEVYVYIPGTDLDRRRVVKRAVEEFDIDITRSFFLTDHLSGLEAGITIGIQPVLVLTQNGLRSLCELLNNSGEWGRIWQADPLVCRDLYAFVDKDVVQPLSIYAQTDETPCKEVAHSNSERIQQSLHKYIEAVRKTVLLSRTAGL